MVAWDAVVVGGGVAGAATALQLGRRGLRVALVEKARFPRPKPCGEGLLPHGVSALAQMGLDFPGVTIRGIRYVSPSGYTAEADFPQGQGRVVRREHFDAFLFRAAARTPNVEAFEGIAYDPERFPARWVVGADGIRSRFHRLPALAVWPPRTRRVGLSAHVRGLEVDRERVEVVLHPGGEVYLAPSDGDEALVACLCWPEALPPGTTNSERVLHLLRSLKVLRGRLRGVAFTTPVLATAPLGLRVGAVRSGNVLLVGDAAGAPDPVTGEGMSLALLSARAAAEAIASGRPQDYDHRRRTLAAGSEWVGRWILRTTRHPAAADRVVGWLGKRPALLARLLEIATGARRKGGDDP